MIPFEPFPLLFDEVEDRPRDDAVADLPEFFPVDPERVDLEDAVLEPVLFAEEPDFPAAERDVEPDPLLPDVDELAFDRAVVDRVAVPLPADDDFDFDEPPVVDFWLAERAPVLFFSEEPFEEALLVEREEPDFAVEDFAPEAEDFDFEAEDFDPPDLDVDDFAELARELEDFLVVAMIFLRVIE